MKRLYLLLSMTAFLAFAHADNYDLAPLYQQLNEAIDSIPVLDAQYQERIATLKAGLRHRSNSPREEFELNNQIVWAYSKFSYDSTFYYIKRNLELARTMGNQNLVHQMLLRKAKLYAHAGAYLEAMHLMQGIDETQLPDSLERLYCETAKDVYGEAGHYSRDEELHLSYRDLANRYQTRLLELLDTTSIDYFSLRETRARNRSQLDEALGWNDRQLALVAADTPEFSEVAFFRSEVYKRMDDRQMQKYWLLRSAISDVRNSVKDQASLWTLADLLSEEGDVETSYRLIRTSQDGLRYYNTPLRNLQSATVLSLIDHNYHLMAEQQNRQLRWLVTIVSLLALLLFAAVVYVDRQRRRLAAARQELHEANQQLTDLNGQLKQAVDELHESNNQLQDSNRIKEVYIGRFLTLCSSYMKKMDTFRSAVLKKEKSGQLAEYLAPDRMRELKEKDVDELMDDFDKAFLHIIPTFIDDFNALLLPEGQIAPPKKAGRLNTELRIFALIRLGITDSSKIAEFLHYSVHTIYNYRSTVKNAARGSREDFEDEVKKIGNP